MVTPTAWLMLVATALPPCSCHLYPSQLCWSLGEMKAMQVLHAVSHKAGEAARSPHSSFPREGNSFYQGISLLALSSVGLEDGLMQAK